MNILSTTKKTMPRVGMAYDQRTGKTTNMLRYRQERAQRWEMEAKESFGVMERVVRKHIKPVFNKATFQRFDEVVFYLYDPARYRWARGTPDFEVDVGHNDDMLYIELKIKQERFRKTVFGGTTLGGAHIPAYGCESVYLDKYVYEQMRSFCTQCAVSDVEGDYTGRSLSPEKYLILFCDRFGLRPELVSLQIIINLIEWGYCGVYSEGYGSESYLIPVDVLTPVEQFDFSGHLADALFNF